MEGNLVTPHGLRASAAFSATETVTFSPTSLMRFTKNAVLYFKVTNAAALDFEAELQRSPDNSQWFTVEKFGAYTANGNYSEDVRDRTFGQYQRLVLTRTAGSCTLEINAEIEEVL